MDPPSPTVDLLSSLPEHLQDEILMRLEVLDAVRTSALSRAWRRRWETLPRLALSFPNGTPASVVDCVLRRYAGPSVSRFACHLDTHASRVEDWLIALSRRDVESISIIFHRPGRLFTVHSSIFSCNRLVSLALERCCFRPLPQLQSGGGGGFAGGFPVLKELYLTCVEFAENGERQLQAMIRASPMLCVLLLKEVYVNDADCLIEAPNLHTLGLISCNHEFVWEFGDLPCLQYASINVPHYIQLSVPAKVFAGVSQVQELILNLPLCYFKTDPIPPFTFFNLKSMGLLTDFWYEDKIILMFCLLRSSPNLEKLKIEVQRSQMVVNQNFLNAQWTDGMFANLKVVQIISYKSWLPFYFVKFILSKARLLRTLSVDVCPVSHRLNELLNCKRASPQAQILFKVQLERIRFDSMRFAEKRLN